jgi:hypothetical protein
MVELEIPIARESQKQSVVEVDAWASWGAAVLRPYIGIQYLKFAPHREISW